MSGFTSPLRERKKDRQRWALVRAALGLFEERGFAQTTVEAIAAAADVSPRTFFRYFESKDDVILIDPAGKLALVDRALDSVAPDEPILERLGRGWASLAGEYLSDREAAAAIQRVCRAEPILAARLYAFQTQWSHALAAAISRRLGGDPSVDARAEIISSTAQALVGSALERWVEAGSPGEPRNVVDSAIATIGPALEAAAAAIGTFRGHHVPASATAEADAAGSRTGGGQVTASSGWAVWDRPRTPGDGRRRVAT